MQDRRRGKTDAEKLAQKQKANRTVLSRTMIMMLICTVVLFTPLVFTLFRIMILEHDKYEKMAIGNQTKTTKLTAERGVIYDRNMNILASSVSAENVFLDPMEIANEKQDTGVLAKGLSEILGVEADFVLKQAADSAYRYKTIQKKLTPEKAQEVREFINKNDIKGVHLEPDARRHYPYRSLAAQVIGFVNTDNSGTEGLEAYYDTSLTGNEGKVITTKGNAGTEMLYTYEKYYDAQNGNDLVLTIDSTVQYYLEKNLENAIDKYTVLNGAFGIVMDVNSGEILGMATLGSYDPNNYLEIYDTQKAEELEELYQKTLTYTKGSDDYKAGIDEYNSGVAAARLRQWRNRPVSDGYEPGSTFKLITLAAALNENCVTLNDSFFCGGRADFAGRSQTLHCWKHE
ncbi:MAG: stage V sporulation protein D, partial [Oscillospiraceae bacterium]|nr:stage V sporulation protein D [Oscillospiraceae bacterium]